MKTPFNSIKDKVKAIFSDEDRALDLIFRLVFPDGTKCLKCGVASEYRRVPGRKCYRCTTKKCSQEISPLASTIMENSTTAISTWVSLIVDFCSDHRGISSQMLGDDYGLTDKAAFRICHQIRKGMSFVLNNSVLSGLVQIDEHFYGGKRLLKNKKKIVGQLKTRTRSRKNIKQKGIVYSTNADKITESKKRKGGRRKLKVTGKGISDKMMIFGLLADNGALKLFHINTKDKETLRRLIYENVEAGSTIHHDSNPSYGDLTDNYKPVRVLKKDHPNFKKGENNNRIENFWKHFKDYMAATYGSCGKEHLQLYLNEFSFRNYYNRDKLRTDFLSVIFSILTYGRRFDSQSENSLLAM